MADKDFFAPPTEEEVLEAEQEMFAAPPAEKPEVGFGEALLRGAETGVTFGFPEEISGVLGAGLEAVGMEPEPGESKLEQLRRVYKEYRDVARERYKAAEEARPYTTTAGGIAGGFLVPGGLFGRAAARIPKTATGLRKALELGKAGAKVSAPAGALGAAGATEAELVPEPGEEMELGQFGLDVLTGTGLGSGLGAAVPVVGAKAAQLAKGTRRLAGIVGEETVGPTAEAFERGLKGEMIVGEKARRELEKEIRGFGEELAPQLQESIARLGKSKRKILERATGIGKKLDLDRQVTEASEAVRAIPELDEATITEKLRLQKLLERFKEDFAPDEVSPQDADLLRKAFAKLSKMGEKSLQDPDTRAIASRAAKELGDVVKEVPGIRAADKKIAAFHRAMKTIGIKDTRNMDEQKILDKFTQIIRKQQAEGASAEKARRVADDFLDDLKIAAPKLAQRVGDQIQDLAAKADISQVAQRPIYLPRPLATLEAYTVKGGNLAGYGIRELTPDSMIDAASRLTKIGTRAADQLSQALQKASTKNQRGRNAVIFGLIQNPEYRDLLRRVQGEEIEEAEGPER